MTRIELDVPYARKDEAKRHGAKWDPLNKKWYLIRPTSQQLVSLCDFLPARYKSQIGSLVKEVKDEIYGHKVPSNKKWEIYHKDELAGLRPQSRAIKASMLARGDSASPHPRASPSGTLASRDTVFISEDDVPY